MGSGVTLHVSQIMPELGLFGLEIGTAVFVGFYFDPELLDDFNPVDLKAVDLLGVVGENA